VTLQPAALDDVDGDGNADFQVVAQPELVYGRLVVENAYGPEIAELPMTVTAQRYAGGQFRVEDRDNATPLGNPRIALSDPPADGLAGGDSGIASVNDPLTAGQGGLVLTAPGVGNVGQITVTADALDFLEFDFDNDGSMGDPAGIATFGRYRGDDRILYWREVYQ
jgi:MSHA biogenesis protein MshQ